MKTVAFFLLAASTLRFDITDARGKRPSGVTIEAGDPDSDGWRELKIVKSKGDREIVWPPGALAKEPDGPEPVPVIVVMHGEAKALASPRVAAALAAEQLLDSPPNAAGFDQASLARAFSTLAASDDPFAKGVGLLYAHKASEAADPLRIALRERERQLTRIPSEIYPAAMLYGRALFESGHFDDAALAYLRAMNQKHSDRAARAGRAQSLIEAGKPEAAQDLLEPAK
jgi:hypothetical protein